MRNCSFKKVGLLISKYCSLDTGKFLPIQGARHAILIPLQHTTRLHDQGGACAGDLLVGGVVFESPNGIDLSIDPADGALVFEAHAGGDLFVGETLGQHMCHNLLIGFQ